jgi:hypothetical protein
MDHLKPLPLRQHRGDKRARHFVPPIRPTPTEQSSIAAPQRPPSPGRAPALTAELDPELQAYAEAAIQTFRSSFDAALAENSPVTRERLRQAASNLMRAAARTTIVLDRLNTGAKRASNEMADWPRPSYPQEHARSAMPA